MANLPESNTWESVRQWETNDPALGGTGGVMNTPIQQLVNRTAFLKDLVQKIIAGSQTIVGAMLNGSTCANTYTKSQQNDTAVATCQFTQSAISARAGRRNALLNGDMKIAQRGTSFHMAGGNTIYTLDRWLATLAAGARTADVSQERDTHRNDVYGAAFALKVELGAGTGTFALKQRIENAWTFEGSKATLQFVIDLPEAKDIRLKFSQYLNQSQLSSASPAWEHDKTITVDGGVSLVTYIVDLSRLNSVDIGTVDSANSLEIALEFSETPAVDFWITNIQFEKGEIASDFEIRDDMADCLRFFEVNDYFERYDDKQSVADTGSIFSVFRRQYWTKKRITPSVTKSNETFYGLDTGVSTISQISKNGCTLEIKPTTSNYNLSTRRELALTLSVDAEIN